jgi:ribosomal protein S15P/S13E
MVIHLRKNPRDIYSTVRLNSILTKRRKVMYYLRHVDPNAYGYILNYYGLKDINEGVPKLPKELSNINRHHR